MASAQVRTISMDEFRRTEIFSGERRVRPGSRTRKGVHRQHRQASCKSLVGSAGTGAACETAAGESAHTSAAHAASRDTDTELAKPKGNGAGGTPEKKPEKSRTKNGKGGGGGEHPLVSLWEERWQLDGGDELPADGERFVDEVNSYMGLVRTTELLLRGNDEKSTKSLLEMLLEMKYGKTVRARAVRAQAVIDCVPQAIQD